MNDIAPIIEHENTALVPQPVFLPLASPACAQVCAALAIAQGAFKTPKRTKEAKVEGTNRNGSSYSYKYKYAPLEEILDAVKEAMAANGLARHQYLITRGNQPVMRTIIWHASGEWIASDYPIHPTKEGAQGFASGVTYARRYGLSLALGLAPEDDDDANVADGGHDGSAARTVQGKTAAATVASPPNKPIQAPPPQPVYDPETGEVGPHPIPVPMTREGKPDWIAWGGRLVTELQRADSLAEGEEWLGQCEPALMECDQQSPKVHDRIQANIRVMRERFDAPDFMAADDPLRPL